MPLNRDTVFTWLGHATVLIETPGGKRILIDPWTTGNPVCPEAFKSPESLGKLDLILVTHLHGDHCEDAPAISAANPDTPVATIVESTFWLRKRGVKNLIEFNIGGTLRIGDIAVTMTQAHHSNGEDEDGTPIYGGGPVGYVVRLENGFTFYAAGDTDVFGDMALIKELYQPELAILPIGDHYTMGPKHAALAIKLLGVKHVLPIHYGTFPVLVGTPEALRQEAAAIPDLTVYSPKPGESVR